MRVLPPLEGAVMRYRIAFRRGDFLWSWRGEADPNAALATATELAGEGFSVKITDAETSKDFDIDSFARLHGITAYRSD
jgi:hypothetical protein